MRLLLLWLPSFHVQSSVALLIGRINDRKHPVNEVFEDNYIITFEVVVVKFTASVSSRHISTARLSCCVLLYGLSCVRYNARSNWLIVGHYSPLMPRGRLWACKNTMQNAILINLLTSNVQSLWESLIPRPCRIDLAITRSTRQVLGLRFFRKAPTLGQ